MLIAAIVIVFALASMVLVLCRSMAVEAQASANQAAAIQAAAVARGAEQYVLGIVANSDTQAPLDVDEAEFQAVPVGDGYFWIVRPDYNDNTMPVYGLVDENSKVDINAASVDALMKLPGMTDDVAGSIVDWRDDDDTPTGSGAESSYYLSLPDPYAAKNANFETVEELLLVRGMTPQFLYGDGTAGPMGSGSQIGATNLGAGGANLMTDPALAHGLYDLLTIYSRKPNTAADGTKRINVNDANPQTRVRLLQLLTQKLSADKAGTIMTAVGRGRVQDVFDLYFRANMTRDDFDAVGDYLTAVGGNNTRGRINVNTAPREVLVTLADGTNGLAESDIDTLIGARGGFNSGKTGLGWIIDALGPKAVGLGERITTSSNRYAADIVAVSGNGRAFKHVRVVVDSGAAAAASTSSAGAPGGTTATPAATPRIIYRRDLTDRGWPMDPQILAAIRAGQFSGTVNNAGGFGR